MYWIAFGDVHESTGLINTIPDMAEADGVIITGDLTNRGTLPAVDSVISAVRAINPVIYAQPGNMDTEVVRIFLSNQGFNIHLKVRELARGVGLMGVGMSAPTPFGTPGEVPESTLVQWLDQTYEKAREYDTLILAVHEPPHGTELDVIGGGQHVGSPGVREFIERVQPTLALTGHIHESKGVDYIGNTKIINPGMLAGGGYIRIDYDGRELTAELMSV